MGTCMNKQDCIIAPEHAHDLGKKALEKAYFMFHALERRDPALWKAMAEDVSFIGPYPRQETFGIKNYQNAIEKDFAGHYALYEDQYELVYEDEETALVMGTCLWQAQESEKLYEMIFERFSIFFILVDGELKAKQIHVSHKDDLVQEEESFPYSAGFETRNLISKMKADVLYDRMTGLNNRNYYEETFNELQNKLDKLEDTLVLYFDLNGFKRVNDTYGHRKGDLLLIAFAQALKKSAQEVFEDASVFRMGGDEFTVIAFSSNRAKFGVFIRALRVNFKDHMFNFTHRISFSVGFSLKPKSKAKSLRELISLADRRMYRCKRYLRAER